MSVRRVIKPLKSHIFYVRSNQIQPGNHWNNLKMSGDTNILLGLSCILQIQPSTWASWECWERRRWTKLFGWNVMHCLKLHVLANPKKQTNAHACFQFASKFKPYCMFRSCFELFILVVLQQTKGLPSLILPIFAGIASLYSSCICSSSVLFGLVI